MIDPIRPGRALHLDADGTLFIADRDRICARDGHGWREVARVPAALPGWAPRAAWRLARAVPEALVRTDRGALVVATRTAVVHGHGGRLSVSRLPAGCAPPRVLVAHRGRVLGGEYLANPARRPVSILVSEDDGRTFEVAHTFEPRQVRHIHAVLPARRGGFWVLVGDHGPEPGIAWLSHDLTDLRWVVRGSQLHRAMTLFDLGDRLVYGTDSELVTNHIVVLEPDTGRVTCLDALHGSVMHGCRFGERLALSTTVEPSVVNRARVTTLWTSTDGDRWTRRLALPTRSARDPLGYPGLILPRGGAEAATLWASGEGVPGLDGQVFSASEGRAP